MEEFELRRSVRGAVSVFVALLVSAYAVASFGQTSAGTTTTTTQGGATKSSPTTSSAPKTICTQGRAKKSHNLTIVMKDKKPDRVEKPDHNSDALHACPGDDISWKLGGSDFEINFKEENPFEWPPGAHKSKPIGNGNRGLTDVVSEKAPRNKPLKYSVTVDGAILDPQIIIDN